MWEIKNSEHNQPRYQDVGMVTLLSNKIQFFFFFRGNEETKEGLIK